MANAFFSFEYGPADSYNENSGEKHNGAAEDWGDFDLFCCYEEKTDDPQKGAFLSPDEDMHEESPEDLCSDFDCGLLDDAFQLRNPTLPSLQRAPKNSATVDSVLTELSHLMQPKKTQFNPRVLASLELLNGYTRRYNKMKSPKLNEQQPLVIPSWNVVDDSKRLSTEEVMRVAGAQYIQRSVRKDDSTLPMPLNPVGCAFSGLLEEEMKDIELARLLLASAEKIGNQQFHRGSILLYQCVNLSSDTGNPVQRVTYYFSEGLQERIDRETGRFTSKGAKGRGIHASDTDVKETVLSPNPAILECYKALPFSQMTLFIAVQAIVESLGSAKKVHLIDLGLKTGIPWTILMQALEARKVSPIEILKITAIGTKNQQEIEATGKMITSFAESMGFSFSFKVIMVENIEDIEEEMFELEEDESIAVYSAFVLRTMLASSDRLDSLMRVIRYLNPCIMLVAEVEGNHNSPSFSNRFIECLFYFSAFFDCLETSMDRNNENRLKTEALHFGEAIKNIVATEGEERIFRNVGIDVWRSFFARFKMVETEFSYSSMYQANSIKKQFSYGNSCTIDKNGKSIIVGWKGTPLESVSAWKFL